MQGLLLIYNVVLIVLYFIPLVLAFLIYNKNKQNAYKYIALLFGVFVLDELVIFMTEFIPWFSHFYKKIIFTAPTLKTIIYLLSFLCMIKIMECVFHYNRTILLYISLIVLILFLLFVPGMKESSMQLWIYYTASSVFSIFLGLYGSFHCRKIPKENLTHSEKLLRNMLRLMIILYFAVIFEDSITLFNPNSLLYRNTRSFSEDCFRIIITIIGVIFLFQKVFELLDQRSSVPNQGNVNATASTAATVKEKPDEFSKFYLFCKEYQLTPREQDIMMLLLDNRSNAEISENLIISLGTEKTHIHNIYTKVEVTKRRELLEVYQNF